MACSRLIIKAQETALFAVSLAFVGRFEHDVVLLFLFLLCNNLFRVFQLGQKNLVFLWLLWLHILHQQYHPKIIGRILKNKKKNECVCIHEIMRLIIMEMKMNMKYRSHRYDIYRPRARYGHKYSKYKKYLSMMLKCIK